MFFSHAVFIFLMLFSKHFRNILTELMEVASFEIKPGLEKEFFLSYTILWLNQKRRFAGIDRNSF